MTRDELVEAATDAARADDRVLAFLLGGSLGAGTADAWSDVDAILVVRAADHPAVVEGARGWVGAFLDVVLWRQIHPPHPLFHAVSREWQRFDLTITVPDRLPYSRDRIRPLLDRADLYDSLPPTPPPKPPSPEAAYRIAEEFLRVLGAAPVGYGREEYVTLARGAGLLRDLLIDLMIAEQAPPFPPGALHLSRILPPEDMAALTALPPIEATRESNLASTRALAEAFIPRARRFLAQLGAEWPADLESACRAHLQRELGVTLAV
jgi:hypothetical protein